MSPKFHILLMVLIVVVLNACGTDAPGQPSKPATYVETFSVTRAPGYEAPSSYTGRVEAAMASAIGFEVGGTLTNVTVNDGDTIAKGQRLASLDTARLSAQRAEAIAALQQVEADLALAEATYARTVEAFEYKGVSEQALDESRQQVQALEAARQVATARVRRTDVDIEKAQLVAPFDGTVIRRLADPGVVMAAGQPLVEVQTASNPEVRIGIAPEVASSLVVGQQYDLNFNDQPGQATLRAIVNRRDEITRTVDALFVIDTDATVVRPGDIATLETDLWIETPGFWLPMASLVQGDRGLWQALVLETVGSDPVLVGHTLEILHADAERAFVRGTLDEGDRLVSTGTQRVVPGQVVRVDAPETIERVARVRGDHAAE